MDVIGFLGKNIDDEIICNIIVWLDGGNVIIINFNILFNYVWNEFLMVYLDWLGLCLMIELEFEKVCCGMFSVVGNEFVWGSFNIYNVIYIYINEGLFNE